MPEILALGEAYGVALTSACYRSILVYGVFIAILLLRPDAEIDAITHENAMRWYRFDPFAHRPRERCTVGALRAEVPDHDVSIRAMDKGRFADAPAMPLGELAENATA